MSEFLARVRICLTLALGEIAQHKGRSVLSTVGVVLGITAMTSMVALSSSITEMTTRFTSGINGPQGFQVTTRHPGEEEGRPAIQTRGVTRNDAPLIRTRCPAVGGALATIHVYGSEVARHGRKLEEWNALIGVDETYLGLVGAPALMGRGLAEADVAREQRIAIIAPFIRTNLFDETEACIGQRIEVGRVPFEIVGAITNTDGLSEWLVNRAVIVPISAVPPGLSARGQFGIAAWAAGPDLLPAATQQVHNVLMATHGVEDFQITTNEDMIRLMRRFQRLFSFVFGGVAAIALIVAAVNIMSVTLVSLNRRVREIGVHKAVGAGAADLFAQFIVESLLLSLAGGVLGIVLANTSVRMMNKLLNQGGGHLMLRVSPTTILIGLGFCVGLGFLAGLYPAIRAARMDAVEALRHEG